MTDETIGFRDGAVINLALEACLARCGWSAVNLGHHQNEPSWLYWLDEAFMHGNAGAGALELGRAKDAEQYNRIAVATIKPELEMDRMEYLAQLARARVSIGEVEHACQAAVQAAAAVRRQDSAYTRQQLSSGYNWHDRFVWSLSFGLNWLSKSPPLVSLPE